LQTQAMSGLCGWGRVGAGKLTFHKVNACEQKYRPDEKWHYGLPFGNG
jgi:hypothetical protein